MKFLQVLCLSTLAAITGAQQPISLSEALRSARAMRPAFEAAALRVSQAKLSSRAIGAFPTTHLFVGYSSDPETGGSDDDLVLAQPLDFFGRTSAFRKSGSALVSQATAGYLLVANEIQAEVVTAYIDAAMATELARSALAVEAVYGRLHEATRLRVEGGVAPGFHLTQVSLDLEQARLRTEQRRAEADASLQRLSVATGIDPRHEVQAGFPSLETIEPGTEMLLRQRPDLLLLAAEFQTAEAEVGVTRASGMPELELQARRTSWQQRDDRYGLRLQLAIPLFDHGRVRSETKAATVRAEAARMALADATKLALGEIRAARIEVDSAKDQVGKFETLVARARDLVERLRPGLTEQATTLIEVLDATRILRDLEQAHVEARARLAQAQARHLKATGRLIEVTH